MKSFRTLYILFLLLFAGNTLFSQEHSIGVKGGINLPFVNFTDFIIDANYNQHVFTTGYGAVTYRYMSSPLIGIQADLGISQKGWGQSFIGEDEEVINTILNTIDYLELPVYFRVNFFGEKKFNISINAGIYLSYALRTQRLALNFNEIEQSVAIYDIEEDNRGDFGLTISGTVSYKFPFGEVQLEGGYRTGFANILLVSHITKENPLVSTNQVPFITLNYLIPFHKLGKD